MSLALQTAVQQATLPTDQDLFPGVTFSVPSTPDASSSTPPSRDQAGRRHQARRQRQSKGKHSTTADRIHKRSSHSASSHRPASPLPVRVSPPDTETFNRLFQEWRANRLASNRAQADMLAKRERALANLAETVAELRLHPVPRTTTPTASSPMATKLSPNRHHVRLPVVNTTSMSALERSIVKSNTSLVASELALSLKSKKNEEKAAEIRARVAGEMREECDRIMHRDSRMARPRFGQLVNEIPSKPSTKQVHRIERLLPVLAEEIPKLLAPRPLTPPLPTASGEPDSNRKAIPVPRKAPYHSGQQVPHAKIEDFADLVFTPRIIKLTAHQSSTIVTIAQKSVQASRVHWLPVPIEHEHHLRITPVGPDATRWCRTLHTGHRMGAKVSLKSPGAVQPNTGLCVLVEINGIVAEWPVVVDEDQCSLHVPNTRAIAVSPAALEHSIQVVNRGMGPGTAMVELEDEFEAISIEPECRSFQLGSGDTAQVSFCVNQSQVLSRLDAVTRSQGKIGAVCIKSALSGAIVAKVPVTVTGFARPLEWVQGSAFAFHPSPVACPVQQTFMLRNSNPWPERYCLRLKQPDAKIDVQLTPHQGSISAHSEVPIRMAVAAACLGYRNKVEDPESPLEFDVTIECSTRPAGLAQIQLSGLFFNPRLDISHSHVVLPPRMLVGDKHATTITLTNPLPVPQLIGMDAHASVSFSALVTSDHVVLEPNASISGTLCFSALSAGKVATQVVFRGLVPSGPVTSFTVSITGHVHQPIVQLSTTKLELGITAPGSISSSTVELSWCFNEREKAGKEHRPQDSANFIVGNDPGTAVAAPPSALPTSVSGNALLLSPTNSAPTARPRSGSSARPRSLMCSTNNIAAPTAAEAPNPMAVQVVRVEGPVAEILAGTNTTAPLPAAGSPMGTDSAPLPTDLTRFLHIQNGHGELQPHKRPSASVSFLFVPPKTIASAKNNSASVNPDGSTDQPTQPGTSNGQPNSTQPLQSRGSRVVTDGSKSLAPPGDALQGSTNGKRAGSASKNRAKAGAGSAAPSGARSGAATANAAANTAGGVNVPTTGPQPPPKPPSAIPPMLSATITYRVPVMIFLTRRHGATTAKQSLPAKHTTRFLSEDTRLDWTLQHIDVTCTLTSPTMSIHMPPMVEFGAVAMGCVTTTKLRLLNHHPTQALTPELSVPLPFRLSKAARPIAPLSHGDICLALDSTAYLLPPAPLSADGSQVTRKLSLHSHGTRASAILSGTVYAPQIAWSVSTPTHGDEPIQLASKSESSNTDRFSTTTQLSYDWALGDIYFGDSPTLTLTVSNATAFPVPIRKSSCSMPLLSVVWQPADILAPKSSASVTLALSLPSPANPAPDPSVIGLPHSATARVECQGSVLHITVTWTPWVFGLNLLGLPLVNVPPQPPSSPPPQASDASSSSSIPVSTSTAVSTPLTAMLPLHLIWTRVATLGRGFARQAVYAVTWPRGLYAMHIKPGQLVQTGHSKGDGGGKQAAGGGGGKGSDKHASAGVHASIVFGEFHMPMESSGGVGNWQGSAGTASAAAAPMGGGADGTGLREAAGSGQAVQTQQQPQEPVGVGNSRPSSPFSAVEQGKPSTPQAPTATTCDTPPVSQSTASNQQPPTNQPQRQPQASHHPHTTPPIPTHLLVQNLFSSNPRSSCVTIPVGQPVSIDFGFHSTEYITVLSPATPQAEPDLESLPAVPALPNVPPTTTLLAIPWNKPVPDLTGAFMDMVLGGGYDAETKRMAAGDAVRVVRVVVSMSIAAGKNKGQVPRANEEVDWEKVMDVWEAEKGRSGKGQG